MWIAILDKQLMELTNQFQSDSDGMMKATASLLLVSESFGKMEELFSTSMHYGLSVEGSELAAFV